MDGIRGLNSPKIRDVRGRGLMIGVELKERVTPTLRALQDRGVLVLPATPVVFRLLPPLIWEEPQVDEFLIGTRSPSFNGNQVRLAVPDPGSARRDTLHVTRKVKCDGCTNSTKDKSRARRGTSGSIAQAGSTTNPDLGSGREFT